MNNRPKIIKASLLAPIAVLLPLAALAVASLMFPELIGNGLDDAPTRSAVFILIVVIPLAFPIVAVAMIATSYLLLNMQKLTRKNLIYIAAILSAVTGVLCGFQSPFGIRDQLIGTLIFWSLTMFSLVCGILFWWQIATGHNQSLKQTE